MSNRVLWWTGFVLGFGGACVMDAGYDVVGFCMVLAAFVPVSIIVWRTAPRHPP